MGGGKETFCLDLDTSLQVRRLSQDWSRVGFIKQFVRLSPTQSCQVFATFSGLGQFLQRPRKALAANCLEAEVKEVTFCQQDDSIGKNLQPRNPVVPYI